MDNSSIHRIFTATNNMNKAVFLDRDGILNREIGAYVHRVEDFIINEGVGEALAEWHKRGYLLIVITNQGGISKGLYGHEDVHRLHAVLDEHLAHFGLHITEYFYSPYHKDFCNSLASKPGSLMVERALAKYAIDPSQSFLIGDRERDILAAEGAGVKGLLVESNTDLRSLL